MTKNDAELEDFKKFLDSIKDKDGNINLDEHPELVRGMKIMGMLPWTKEELDIRDKACHALGETCNFELSKVYRSPED